MKEPKPSMMPFNTKRWGQQVRMLMCESKLHVYAVSTGIDTGRVRLLAGLSLCLFKGNECNLRKKQCCGTLSGSAGETKRERLRASNAARMTVSLTQPPT